MKTCYFVAVLLLVHITNNGAAAGVCESCSCIPNDAPVSITCACKTPEMVLDFKPQDFNSAFKNTRNFTLSNCTKAFTFKQNLFRELHNLDNLKIQNMKQVVFEMGVFQTLNHLKLRNINELSFKSNAFRGSEMKSVEIHQSNISDIPQYAFHDINSLEKFVLSDVHIDSVQPNAITLKNSKAVEIINATIDNISSNAMTIEAHTVVIFKSALKKINSLAINITAESQFIISETEFVEDLPNNPIIANSPLANISNNVFRRLTPQIMKNMKVDSNGTILFINNTIDNFESEEPLNIPSSTWNIQGNQFNCSCEMLRLFVNLKNSHILENNYCILSNCRVPVNLVDAKCAKQSSANLDDTGLCKEMPTVTPISRRGGKGLGITVQEHSEDHFTTTSTTPRSSANIPLVSVFSFWAVTALILF